mmetsp:Transcript_6901/g.13654  ORF Transcript_6901/g.13654 Transcript_6901/m.13654 type:complete len:769 (+) Transcript_6901:61-2367(+)
MAPKRQHGEGGGPSDHTVSEDENLIEDDRDRKRKVKKTEKQLEEQVRELQEQMRKVQEEAEEAAQAKAAQENLKVQEAAQEQVRKAKEEVQEQVRKVQSLEAQLLMATTAKTLSINVAEGDDLVERQSRAESSQPIQQAFRQEYRGELDPEIREAIKSLLCSYDPKRDLAPFVTFFQSSGWGKTRFFTQLSNVSESEHIVYLHIPSGIGGNGYPSPQALPELRSVLTGSFQDIDAQVAAWKDLLLRILTCAISVRAHDLWKNFYVDDPPNGLQYSESFRTAVRQPVEVASLQTVTTPSNVVFVIDEAARMGHPENGIEHWRALRRALRDVAKDVKDKEVRILGIAVATVSAGATMHPTSFNDPSLRGPLAQLSRNRPLSGLTCNLDAVVKGRPLWSAYDEPRERARIAAEKLLCSSPLKGSISQYTLEPKCSMVLSRVPFVLPRHAAGAMVGMHMATVLRVAEDGKAFTAGYVSDPCLVQGAAFAAKLLNYDFAQKLRDITELFSKSVHNNGSAGDVGELGVCMVLLEAMDGARLSKQTVPLDCFTECNPVTLSEFLARFLSSTSAAFHPDLDSSVNFTHFARVYDCAVMEKDEFADSLWERQAAALCPPGYAGIDIMIPVLHSTSTATNRKFFWVMIQSKNYNDKSSIPASAMVPQENRFCRSIVKDSQAITTVTCGGLYFLLNLRGRPERSRQQVEFHALQHTEDAVTYTSRCVRVPDRSFLRALTPECEKIWEELMGLHRYGDKLAERFSRDSSRATTPFVTSAT